MSEAEIESVLKAFLENGYKERNQAKADVFTWAKFNPAVQNIKSNFRRFTDFYVEPSESVAYFEARSAIAAKNQAKQQQKPIPDEQTLRALYEQEVATKW